MESEVGSEVDEEQAVVVALLAKESHDERSTRQHGSVHTPRGTLSEDSIFPSEREEVRVERIHFGVCGSLLEIELAGLERVAIVGRGKTRRRSRRDRRELEEKVPPTRRDELRQTRFMVREEQEGMGGGKLFPLEEEGGPGPEQQESYESAKTSWAHHAREARAMHRVGDLIVILQKRNKLSGARSRANVPRGFFCQE